MSWRDEANARLSALAGLDPDGGILPPPPGGTIDQSGNDWWRNRPEPEISSMGLTIEAPYPGDLQTALDHARD